MGGAGSTCRRPASSSATARSSSPAVVGVVTTLVASVAPAIKASRVAPLAALRDVAVDRSATSKAAGRRRRCSSPAPASPPSSRASSTQDGAVARAGLGALAMLVGAVVLGPVVARPAAAVLGAGASVTRGSPAAWPGATRCATPGAPPAAPRR